MLGHILGLLFTIGIIALLYNFCHKRHHRPISQGVNCFRISMCYKRHRAALRAFYALSCEDIFPRPLMGDFLFVRINLVDRVLLYEGFFIILWCQ